MVNFQGTAIAMIVSCFCLLLLVPLTYSVCVQRSCPLGQFCSIGANCSSNASGCVTVCPTDTNRMVQGNWETGHCERSKDILTIHTHQEAS